MRACAPLPCPASTGIGKCCICRTRFVSSCRRRQGSAVSRENTEAAWSRVAKARACQSHPLCGAHPSGVQCARRVVPAFGTTSNCSECVSSTTVVEHGCESSCDMPACGSCSVRVASALFGFTSLPVLELSGRKAIFTPALTWCGVCRVGAPCSRRMQIISELSMVAMHAQPTTGETAV